MSSFCQGTYNNRHSHCYPQMGNDIFQHYDPYVPELLVFIYNGRNSLAIF